MKRVLLTPLDWGLGHATRCIPIINALLDRSCEVTIAGSGDSLKLLQAEFPALRAIEIPGYRPNYPRTGAMVPKMIGQLPKFITTIRKEHEAVKELIEKYRIELVISDNRYGAWSDRVKSVFITHQSNILMPRRFGWMQQFVRNQNLRLINRFSRCWIPDYANGTTLAGELIAFGKEKLKIPVDHIGPLSRFKRNGEAKVKYDITAIFSGPEPQRTILEDTVMPMLKRSGLKYFVVRGLLSSEKNSGEANVAQFLRGNELQEVIEASEIILARSGYSTVMDLLALGKKAIFIPTPGQTEQQYLATELMSGKVAFSMSQREFNLTRALEESRGYNGFTHDSPAAGTGLLDKAVDSILR